MKKPAIAVVLLGMLSSPLFAADAPSAEHHKHDLSKTPATASKATPATTGVVRGIDAKAGTITVEHGPIQNLGMAAMTMPFHVKDPTMLKAVKPGDKIAMTVELLAGKYTITSLQRTP